MVEMWKMIPSHNQGLQSNHLWSHCSFLCSSTVADVAQRDRGDVLSNFIRWHHCPGLQVRCWKADTETSTLTLVLHSWASGWHLLSQRQICFWASGEAGGVTSQGKKVSCLTRSGNWDAPRTERQAAAGAASDVWLFHCWLQECPVSQQSGPEMQYVWWIWSRPTLEIPFLWWISAGSPHSTCLWCCLHL